MQRHLRLWKYKQFHRQNKIFVTEANKLQRLIGSQIITIEKTPLEREINYIWNNISVDDKRHDSTWLTMLNQDQKKYTRRIQGKQRQFIIAKEIKHTLIKSHKWKSSRINRIPNFSTTYAVIATFIPRCHISATKKMKEKNP